LPDKDSSHFLAHGKKKEKILLQLKTV